MRKETRTAPPLVELPSSAAQTPTEQKPEQNPKRSINTSSGLPVCGYRGSEGRKRLGLGRSTGHSLAAAPLSAWNASSGLCGWLLVTQGPLLGASAQSGLP